MIGRMFLTTFGLWSLWIVLGFAGEDVLSGGGGAIYGAGGLFAGIVYFFPIILGLPLIYTIHGGGFATRSDWVGHGVIAAMSFVFMAGLFWFFMRGSQAEEYRSRETFYYIVFAACPLIISRFVYALVMGAEWGPPPAAPGEGGTA